MSLLLFLAMSNSGLRTVVFTSNGTWTCPAGVTNVPLLSGKGGDGTTSSVKSTSTNVTSVQYQPVGTAGGGNILWDNVQGTAAAVANDLNDDGQASYTQNSIVVYPDGTNNVFPNPTSINDAVPGSASSFTSGSWSTSGPISSSGDDNVSYDYIDPAAAGENATGLGRTFPGGPPASPATTTTFTNVPVTPGQNYPIVVPPGGNVTINY